MEAASHNDYSNLTAGEVVEHISSGALSCREVLESCIERLVANQERINAIAVPLLEQARAEADDRDAAVRSGKRLGLLHGVPITVKESFDVKGTPTTLGLPSREGQIAVKDSPVVACLRNAGAVLIGKTNVPQLVVGNECDNPLYGRTNNPWDESRTSGGSSGGEAAAVAVGGSYIGLGSDTGASIRLPASACGVLGFKPTADWFSMEGHGSALGEQPAIVAQPGPLARCVDDLTLALQAMHEGNAGSLPWRGPQDVRLEELRFAVYFDNGVLPPSPAIRRALKEAAAALKQAGATVDQWTPPNMVDMWQTYLELLFTDGLDHLKATVARDPKSKHVKQLTAFAGIPKWLLPLLQRGGELTGQRIAGYSLAALAGRAAKRPWEAQKRKERLCEEFFQQMERRHFDGIICPVDALPALPHGTSESAGAGLSYCALYNLLGMPAGVVAATRVRRDEETERQPTRDRVERAARKAEIGSSGLPVGVQVVAPRWKDPIVLAAMRCLENSFSKNEDYPLRQTVFS